MHVSRKIASRFLFVVCILFFITCTIYSFIPVILGKKLLPGFAESIGFSHAVCEIRKFSLTRLDLASLQWGDPANPLLSIDSARFDFSFFGLLKKRIDKIVVSGLEVRAEYHDGMLSFPGLNFEKFFQEPPEAKQNSRHAVKQHSLPVIVKELEIHHATLLLKSGDAYFRIPFGINAKYSPIPEKGNAPGYDLQIWLSPDLPHIFPGMSVASRIEIHSNLDLAMDNVNLQINLSGVRIEYNGYQILNSPGNTPLIVEITKRQDAITFNFSRFCVLSPLPVEISTDRKHAFTLRVTDEGVDMNGKVYLHFNKELINDHSSLWLGLLNTEILAIKIHGRKNGKRWSFRSHTSGTDRPLELRGQGETLSFHPKIFTIRGEGNESGGNLNFMVKVASLQYHSDTAKVNIPDFRVYGNLLFYGAEDLKIKASAKLSDGELTMGDLHAGKIEAKIPFQWPAPSIKLEEITYRNEGGGYFHVPDLTYSTINIGAIDFTPYQNSFDFLFTGKYKELLPGVCINFSGKVGMNNKQQFSSQIHFKSSDSKKDIKLELGKFSPQLTDMSFEGIFAIAGECNVTGNDIGSNALIAIHDARIEDTVKKAALEGINLNLNLQDLYNFRSPRGQILKFRRFTWGDVEMLDGEMEFQIESPKDFFLERSDFSWCGGHVYTHGLHFESEKDKFDITLYCDRLKLATILKQLNIANADGEGAVNGRIPISYGGGKIKILDGFLYSTPGEGGTIRLSTDYLSPGVASVQQSIQLQIAQEALKNFNYDWARLTVQSRGNDLAILMQMDGKPAGLLPFGFNKEVGLYRVTDQPRAHFQGIRFNINFILPLDTILYYKSGLDGLLHHK